MEHSIALARLLIGRQEPQDSTNQAQQWANAGSSIGRDCSRQHSARTLPISLHPAQRIDKEGLLQAVAFDPFGLGAIVDTLDEDGIGEQKELSASRRAGN